ncbi:MAG: hypothetical protein JWQ07_5206, partial [Ramlibacter sp.]|nr:hypothetical protein [Ramlibacter sp.]
IHDLSPFLILLANLSTALFAGAGVAFTKSVAAAQASSLDAFDNDDDM